MPKETIYEHLQREGVSRRGFIKLCAAVAGAMGLSQGPPLQASGLPAELASQTRKAVDLVANALETKPRVPIIWMEFQDCAGCSEALTRSQSPTLTDLVLNEISIEYHETLTAAAGFQTEANKDAIMEEYAGQYILVIEGSIPTGRGAVYCTIGGRTGEDLVLEAAETAGAIIAIGNCSSFGGLPAAAPNPTNAKSAQQVLKGKTVVNIPGCPPIPEVFTGTLLHYIVFGQLPELDGLNRPKTFYGQTVHDRCMRRPFYEAGRFAKSFDDEGAKAGWCLYKMGCKGPTTYNACASIKWQNGLSFPIQSGHPCLGCSEPGFWDGGGFYQGQSAPLNRPGVAAAGAAAVVGAAARAGYGWMNQAQKEGIAASTGSAGEGEVKNENAEA
jgi:hydrogenase small subunit